MTRRRNEFTGCARTRHRGRTRRLRAGGARLSPDPGGSAREQTISLSTLQPGGASVPVVTSNEYEESAYAVAEGKRVYRWYNCNGCHANGGGGIGPPLMDDLWIYGSVPANVVASILEGRPNGITAFRGKLAQQRPGDLGRDGAAGGPCPLPRAAEPDALRHVRLGDRSADDRRGHLLILARGEEKPVPRGMLLLTMVLLLCLSGIVAAVGLLGPEDRDPAPELTVLTGSNPERGRQALKTYGCTSCHVIPGLPQANGLVGPSLEHFASRIYVGGVVPNTPENLVAWIRDPRTIDPMTAMPATGISEAEAHDAAAYLYTLH